MARVAERVAVLDAGHILEQGALADVLAHSADERPARRVAVAQRGARRAQSTRVSGGPAADGLWQDPAFRLLFLADAISFAGSQITRFVLPTLVFPLTGSTLQTSLLLALQTTRSNDPRHERRGRLSDTRGSLLASSHCLRVHGGGRSG